ncbi:MAG: DUF1294 domain-containing protein [Paludibacter sp.]
MYTYYFAIYLLIINFASGILFAFDKQAAISNKRRVPEFTLHLFEILGGILANIIFMYTLRHKNRKFSYYWFTWLIMIGWLILICILIKYLY